MRSEEEITKEVIERLATSTTPRIKQVSEVVVRHLHAIVRELRLTREEWEAAIAFLTRTGHLCSDKRQEFILLSDALGVSMLVDAVNHVAGPGSTESTVLGPFYLENPPEFPLGADISIGMEGPRLFVSGSVSSTQRNPLAGATIDVWQSDGEGFYDVQLGVAVRGRGRMHSASDGAFHFWTRLPACYPIPYDGTVGQMLKAQGRHPYRPAHIHFIVEAPGHRKLVTHVFAQGDAYLQSDSVFGVKQSLIREFEARAPGIAPDGSLQECPWHELRYDFGLMPLTS